MHIVITVTNRTRRVFTPLLLALFVLLFLWPAVSIGASKAKAPVLSVKNQELTKLVEAAKSEGKIIWWDSLKPEESAPVIKAFQNKYPFIKVEHVRIHDNDSRERIFREMAAKKVDIDVFDISGEQVPAFKKAGLLEKYDWTRAFDVRSEQLDRDQMLLSVAASMKGLGYNTNLVNGKDIPTRWEDLLDPRWKGKIVVDTRPKPFVHLIPAWGEERVYDYLKKLAANKPTFRRGQQESIELMSAGEFPMIAGTYRHAILLTKMTKGAPIDIAMFDTVPVAFEKEAITKNAAHPNAAKLLLGWLATEGQKYQEQVTHRGIPLPGFDTEAARSAKGKTLSLFTDEWLDREAELQGKALKALGRE
jgi:iron(III) transport system substrate-binding protein